LNRRRHLRNTSELFVFDREFLGLIEHRLCPIFRVSNVTGEGLDYVGVMFFLIREDSDLTEVSYFFESPSIQRSGH
jgi:hypothetical protein